MTTPHGGTLTWYKHGELRQALILVLMFLLMVVLLVIALSIHHDVKLNERIEVRQVHQRDRTCLLITAESVPDPKGLCAPATIATEDH